MLAAQRGHKDAIKSLLEKKANPNITDKVGLFVLATLLQYGSSHLLCIVPGCGKTILIHAV
jgi:ankyrin repeat protein